MTHILHINALPLFFTEFIDASSDTLLAWVGTGFRHITPTISNTQHYIFTVPGSRSCAIYFLKVLIELQLILHCDSTFQWSTTLLLKTNFLTSSLNLLLNSFILWPLLPLTSSLKNISLLGLLSDAMAKTLHARAIRRHDLCIQRAVSTKWSSKIICTRLSAAVVGRWSVRAQSERVMADCFIHLSM